MSEHRSPILYPLSLIYGGITGFRNFLYNVGILPSVEFRIPVICVGNITVGGTGKTPHVEYLINILSKEFKVAVLSRGYKRDTIGFKTVKDSSRVSQVGDEPLQMARKFPDILVAVDKNRKNGIREILKARPEIEVILLDDAFQHRQITPGFSILLSDFGRLMTRDYMLPYGNLRENTSNIRRADAIIISKSPNDLSPMQRRLIGTELDKKPYQHVFFTSIKYHNLQPLFGTNDPSREPDFSKPDRTGILLVTGIANPRPLKEFIKPLADEVVHLQYPDHHKFKDEDIKTISESFAKLNSPVTYIITTEKDSVRLKEFTNITDKLQNASYYFPIGIDFLHDNENDFEKLITDYVRKNKRNNRISEK